MYQKWNRLSRKQDGFFWSVYLQRFFMFSDIESEIPPLSSFSLSPAEQGEVSLDGPLARAKGADTPSQFGFELNS